MRGVRSQNSRRVRKGKWMKRQRAMTEGREGVNEEKRGLRKMRRVKG